MKTTSFLFVFLFFSAALCTSCNNEADSKEEMEDSSTTAIAVGGTIKEEAVSFQAGTATSKSYIAYDSAITTKRPIILVVPEWWGLNDYPMMRARKLAQLGYLAMAVDLYGNGKVAANPNEAQKAAGLFYQNPQEAKTRLEAALAVLKSYPQADTTKTAAIGYCFGGSMVLNAAKLGTNFNGVVSFHGGLEGVPARKDLLKSKILICHGAADSFVPPAQVAAFRKSLDSIGADYTFKAYPNATHAFTNPDADNKAIQFKMPIHYNGAADTASWNDMQAFFKRLF